MPNIIRPYESSDEAAVVRVWHRAGLATYTFLPSWQSLTLDEAGKIFHKAILSHCNLWVGMERDTLVAFMALDGTLIDRMYVDPDHWRQGWGSKLMGLAKQLQPVGLELFTHVENHGARRFYEKHGFRAVNFGVSPPPESAPDVEYHWRP